MAVVAVSSQRRSSASMKEATARQIASETDLFGYTPELQRIDDRWYLWISDNRTDDGVVTRRIAEIEGHLQTNAGVARR